MRTTWRQAFRWGLLMAGDPAAPSDMPVLGRDGAIVATPSCLCVPVLHAADVVTPPDQADDEPLPEATVEVTVVVHEPREDVDPAEFEATLTCPSGRLLIGDAETEREFSVPIGTVDLAVTRDPVDFAERVVIHVMAARHGPLVTASSAAAAAPA